MADVASRVRVRSGTVNTVQRAVGPEGNRSTCRRARRKKGHVARDSEGARENDDMPSGVL